MERKTTLSEYFCDTYLKKVKEVNDTLLQKIKETIISETNGFTFFEHNKSTVRCLWNGVAYKVQGLYIRNGHMRVMLKETLSAPLRQVAFSSMEALVKDVIAATRFPDHLRKEAELFYGKPVEIFGKTICIVRYLYRQNNVRRDYYVFEKNDGEPVAISASEIKRLAETQCLTKR